MRTIRWTVAVIATACGSPPLEGDQAADQELAAEAPTRGAASGLADEGDTFDGLGATESDDASSGADDAQPAPADAPVDGWRLIVRDATIDVLAMQAANKAASGEAPYVGDLTRLERGGTRLVRATIENVGNEIHSWYPGVSLSTNAPALGSFEPFWLYALLPGDPYDASFEVEVADDLAPDEVVLTFDVTAMGCSTVPAQACPQSAPITLTLPVAD